MHKELRNNGGEINQLGAVKRKRKHDGGAIDSWMIDGGVGGGVDDQSTSSLAALPRPRDHPHAVSSPDADQRAYWVTNGAPHEKKDPMH